MIGDLKGKQVRQLRAMGHDQHVTLQIGKEGVTPAILKQAETELLAHELVKVKVLETAPDDVVESLEQVARAQGAIIVQRKGRVALIYRPHPLQPRIALGG